MADHTSIEWTDATWNPTVGCSVLTPGCTNCYAQRAAARHVRQSAGLGRSSPYEGLTIESKAGPVWNGIVRINEKALMAPLDWKRPRRIFVNSMSDLFHEALSDSDIARVFTVMANCPQHTFQVLTKRAQRMHDLMAGPKHPEHWHPQLWHRGALPNVWLGVSVEDQRRANERIPLLLQTPAAVRFLSCEPLLERIEVWTLRIWRGIGLQTAEEAGIDWVIVGGESGPGARRFDIEWAEALRDECQATSTAFFLKQLGSNPWSENGSIKRKDRAGGDWNEWPESLRVRQFPLSPSSAASSSISAR